MLTMLIRLVREKPRGGDVGVTCGRVTLPLREKCGAADIPHPNARRTWASTTCLSRRQFRTPFSRKGVLSSSLSGENGGNDGLPSRTGRRACRPCRRGYVRRRFVQPVAGIHALLPVAGTVSPRRRHRHTGCLLVSLGPLRGLGLASLGLAPLGLASLLSPLAPLLVGAVGISLSLVELKSPSATRAASMLFALALKGAPIQPPAGSASASNFRDTVPVYPNCPGTGFIPTSLSNPSTRKVVTSQIASSIRIELRPLAPAVPNDRAPTLDAGKLGREGVDRQLRHGPIRVHARAAFIARDVGREPEESRNALARAVCFHRLGRLRDRTAELQQHRATFGHKGLAAGNPRNLLHAKSWQSSTRPLMIGPSPDATARRTSPSERRPQPQSPRFVRPSA